jgi:hypothetical protein
MTGYVFTSTEFPLARDVDTDLANNPGYRERDGGEYFDILGNHRRRINRRDR